MTKRQQYRGDDGAIIHGPDCMGPGPSNLPVVCVCNYVRSHEFMPQNRDFASDRWARGECHECGHKADDPVHRAPHIEGPWRQMQPVSEEAKP